MTICRCTLLALVSITHISFAEPEVYVGADNSRFEYRADEAKPLVGSDPDYRGDDRMMVPPTFTGYTCKEYAQGCPAGAAVLNDQGNVKGCDFVAGPPASCTGDCTVCKGGNTSANLCEREPSASCTLQSGTGSTTLCGESAVVLCGYVAPPSTLSDPRGCRCPPAASYPGSTCSLPRCTL